MRKNGGVGRSEETVITETKRELVMRLVKQKEKKFQEVTVRGKGMMNQHKNEKIDATRWKCVG